MAKTYSTAAWHMAAIIGGPDPGHTSVAQRGQHARNLAGRCEKLLQPKGPAIPNPTPQRAVVPLEHTVAWVRYEGYADESMANDHYLRTFNTAVERFSIPPYGKDLALKVYRAPERYARIAAVLADLLQQYYTIRGSGNDAAYLRVETPDKVKARNCKVTRVIAAAHAKANEARRYEYWLKTYSPLVNQALDLFAGFEQRHTPDDQRAESLGNLLAHAEHDPRYPVKPTASYEQRILLTRIFGDLMGTYAREKLPYTRRPK